MVVNVLATGTGVFFDGEIFFDGDRLEEPGLDDVLADVTNATMMELEEVTKDLDFGTAVDSDTDTGLGLLEFDSFASSVTGVDFREVVVAFWPRLSLGLRILPSMRGGTTLSSPFALVVCPRLGRSLGRSVEVELVVFFAFFGEGTVDFFMATLLLMVSL